MFGFTNPPAGQYEIEVAAETRPDGALETGTAMVDIRPATTPTISVTSLLSEPPGLNAIYQQAKLGGQPPRPYDFLVWDADGAPLEGVEIAEGKLVKDGQAIGEATIDAPAGATGQMVSTVRAPLRRGFSCVGISCGDWGLSSAMPPLSPVLSSKRMGQTFARREHGNPMVQCSA